MHAWHADEINAQTLRNEHPMSCKKVILTPSQFYVV